MWRGDTAVRPISLEAQLIVLLFNSVNYVMQDLWNIKKILPVQYIKMFAVSFTFSIKYNEYNLLKKEKK